MYGCNFYNLDNVFKQFKVVEFPISFVGLSTSQVLDVENDLNTCTYLKTIYDGNLMVRFFLNQMKYYILALRGTIQGQV